jgi:preprotein translocase subunit SecD
MSKRIRWRTLIILAVTALSIYLFAGFPPSLAGMRERLRLGLDLQGGVQLVLQVQTDDALQATTDQTIEGLQDQLQKDNITVRQIHRVEGRVDEFRAVGVDAAKDSEFRNLIAGVYVDWDITSATIDVPNTYTLKLKPRAAALYRDQSVDQALQTITTRVDQLGVTEPVIQRRGGAGEHEILVQFPGETDPAKVKGIIGRPAVLQFRAVMGMTPFPTRAAALQQFGGVAPPGIEVIESQDPRPDGGRDFWVVNARPVVTGRHLKSASVSSEAGFPVVAFNFNAEGAAAFGNFTGQNIGKLLGIVLDSKMVSAPVLEGRITDSGIIRGNFTQEEVMDLVLVLRSGSLPARMVYLEEEVVGASLGADSIRSGVAASLAALAGVLLFVLIYYKASGINAAVAMGLNLIVLFGALAALGATLTLPGIAGVILTIGMGIDSNILIFERIREELRAGKLAASAVTTSFQRVFVTLVDTHLAALISATFLFLFGTSAIKGFAVTLVVGLIANMFTAVFVSRTLFEIILARKERAETLSI